MRRPMMTALLLPFLLASLTACASDPPAPVVLTRLQVERPQVPADKFICKPKPAVPSAGATQKSVAWFIALLENRGDDCAAKLDELAEIFRAWGATPAIAPVPPANGAR